MGVTSYGQVRDALLEIHSIASEYKIDGMMPEEVEQKQTRTGELMSISDDDDSDDDDSDDDDFDEEDELI